MSLTSEKILAIPSNSSNKTFDAKSRLLLFLIVLADVSLIVFVLGEMIDKLTLTYNRTRQAVITRELVEIISGAAAV